MQRSLQRRAAGRRSCPPCHSSSRCPFRAAATGPILLPYRREEIATAPAPSLSPFVDPHARPLDPAKFRDPLITAKGEGRAHVALERLETLWINTGTLCNLACRSCYIESSPTNDALVYVTRQEVDAYLDEAERLGTREIGFTGGEPFMNRDIMAMLRSALGRGFEVLVLTNAMRPMRRFEDPLKALVLQHRDRLTIRVSLDHHSKAVHEAERGPNTWDKALHGLSWLSEHGFRIAVAGRLLAGESEAEARIAYDRLFARHGLKVNAGLVLFPEMDSTADVPEITTACWGILDVAPAAMMCATSRMVVKHKGAQRPHVVACTLLPYDPQFALGETLAGAGGKVMLNHPHCARFCVLGGASCTG